MGIFHRFIRLFVTFLFGFVLLIPSFSHASGRNDLLIMNAFPSTCTWNIQCESLDSSHYICYTSNHLLSTAANIGVNLPISKYSQDTYPVEHLGQYTTYIDFVSKKILYKGPDEYRYPFVRIIKIQV